MMDDGTQKMVQKMVQYHTNWPMLLLRFISAMTERGCGTWG